MLQITSPHDDPMFLVVYMTDIAGISAGAAGAIYGITKIWLAFRLASARPLIVSTLAGASAPVDSLRFSTAGDHVRCAVLGPAGFSATAAIVWILLFDAAYQLLYSFVNIPYGSLSAAMTQDPVDRSRLSGARSIASSVSSVLLAFVVAPQFQDTTSDNIRLQFTLNHVGAGRTCCHPLSHLL